MNKVLVICVNYDSYDYLYSYMDSINNAAEKVSGVCDIEVCIVDNTVNNPQEINADYNNIKCRLFPYCENFGYMGGAVKSLQNLGENYVKSFDYVIVSNVDITLDVTFFERLLTVDHTGLGWVAPSIYRTKQNFSNENPFLLTKPSNIKMNLYILMYSIPFLYNFYNTLHSKRQESKVSNRLDIEKDIFAGMGSIFIFTKEFICNCYPMTFPCFMYGEEVYYGELVQKSGLKTRFIPQLKVYDVGGVSTGALGSLKKCKMNRDSLKIIKSFMQD